MMKKFLILTFLIASPLYAEEKWFGLFVGSNIGLPMEPELKFAVKDAKNMMDVFTTIGKVSSESAFLVINKDKRQVINEFEKIGKLILKTKNSGKKTVFIFYFSGHGENDGIHLMGDVISFEELKTLLRNTGSDLRLIYLDSCKSATLMREKGGYIGNSYQIALSSEVSGEVVIASSGSHEFSLESDTLKDSLFTHYLLNGLKGAADMDSDGAVSLEESYFYTYKHAMQNTDDQHPMFKMDIVGKGKVILTSIKKSPSIVILEKDLEEGRYYLVSEKTMEIVADVLKVEKKTIKLAIPKDRYQVLLHKGNSLWITEAIIDSSEYRISNTKNFRKVSQEKITMKGGPIVLQPWEIGASYEIGRGIFNENFPEQGFRIGLSYKSIKWINTIYLRYTTSAFEKNMKDFRFHNIGIGWDIGRRVLFLTSEIDIGAGLSFEYSFENIREHDSVTLAITGKETTSFKQPLIGFGPKIDYRFMVTKSFNINIALFMPFFVGKFEDNISLRFNPASMIGISMGL